MFPPYCTKISHTKRFPSLAAHISGVSPRYNKIKIQVFHHDDFVFLEEELQQFFVRLDFSGSEIICIFRAFKFLMNRVSWFLTQFIGCQSTSTQSSWLICINIILMLLHKTSYDVLWNQIHSPQVSHSEVKHFTLMHFCTSEPLQQMLPGPLDFGCLYIPVRWLPPTLRCFVPVLSGGNVKLGQIS